MPAANNPKVPRCRYCVSEGQFRPMRVLEKEGRFVRNAVTYCSLKTKRSGVPVVLAQPEVENRRSPLV